MLRPTHTFAIVLCHTLLIALPIRAQARGKIVQTALSKTSLAKLLVGNWQIGDEDIAMLDFLPDGSEITSRPGNSSETSRTANAVIDARHVNISGFTCPCAVRFVTADSIILTFPGGYATPVVRVRHAQETVAPPPPPPAQSLSRQSAAELLRRTPFFQAQPIRTTVAPREYLNQDCGTIRSTLADPAIGNQLATQLISAGIITLEQSPQGYNPPGCFLTFSNANAQKWSLHLTPGRIIRIEDIEADVTNGRSLVQITGIRMDGPSVATVDYDWTRSVTLFGKVYGGGGELASVAHASAVFQKYDDGWRVTSM